jgi:CheY-like chemotaxis protein
MTLRVLVADDVEDSRFLVRRFLERSGEFVVVAEASNGKQAVEMVEEHTPDLALLDLVMPVMDGLEALPLVRQASPETTVVVLSAFAREWMAEVNGNGNGHTTNVLEKGLDPDTFVQELLSVIAKSAPSQSARLALPNALTSPRQARRFVHNTLEEWDQHHLLDDAILLTSELVTNAVLHAESELELRVRLRSTGLRIEVVDQSPRALVRRHQSAEATSGRGLAMVNTLAVLWGSDPVGRGKSVWFELASRERAAS